MNRLLPVAVLALIAPLAACTQIPLTGDDYGRGEARARQLVEYGTVVEVRPVTIHPDESTAGAWAGGAVGGAAGSAVGRGHGSVIGTAAGAVLGAVAGDAIQKKAGERAGVEITVRHEDGRLFAYVQQVDPDEPFKVGDKVKIVTQGGTSRVKHTTPAAQ